MSLISRGSSKKRHLPVPSVLGTFVDTATATLWLVVIDESMMLVYVRSRCSGEFVQRQRLEWSMVEACRNHFKAGVCDEQSMRLKKEASETVKPFQGKGKENQVSR